jgi:hypothetical protein
MGDPLFISFVYCSATVLLGVGYVRIYNRHWHADLRICDCLTLFLVRIERIEVYCVLSIRRKEGCISDLLQQRNGTSSMPLDNAGNLQVGVM